GGWRLACFLPPEGKPIGGGTYWPRDNKEVKGKNPRGLKIILKLVHDWSGKNADEVTEQADKLANATKDALARSIRGIALSEPSRELVDGAIEALKDAYDSQYGGFRSPIPRFRRAEIPLPPYLEILPFGNPPPHTPQPAP